MVQINDQVGLHSQWVRETLNALSRVQICCRDWTDIDLINIVINIVIKLNSTMVSLQIASISDQNMPRGKVERAYDHYLHWRFIKNPNLFRSTLLPAWILLD